jgi:endoglucanase
LLAAASTLAKALPDTPRAGIESLNEPPHGCGGSSWFALQRRLYRELRQLRPHLTIVVSGGDWGALAGLLQLDPSAYRADPNVLFSFHYYEPFLYTHQGAGWLYPGFYKYVQGLPWPYDPGAVASVEANALAALSRDRAVDDARQAALAEGLETAFAGYRQTGSRLYADAQFDKAAAWATKNGIARGRIFVSEFGVVRPTQNMSGAPRPDASRWIGNTIGAARAHGFLWAVFDLDTALAIDCGEPAAETLCPQYRGVFQ